MDLSALRKHEFHGISRSHSKDPCRVSVGEIRRDFAGRFYQDFQFEVSGRPELLKRLRLQQRLRHKSPDLYLGKEGAQYDFNVVDLNSPTSSRGLDPYLIEIVADPRDPQALRSFRLYDRSGFMGIKRVRRDCEQLRAMPR